MDYVQLEFLRLSETIITRLWPPRMRGNGTILLRCSLCWNCLQFQKQWLSRRNQKDAVAGLSSCPPLQRLGNIILCTKDISFGDTVWKGYLLRLHRPRVRLTNLRSS